uniref:Uncharacterized protein n=1 Tax=Anopheles epiroticus TaxID=199890 RepID=A0A182PLW7_9DIPT
MYLQWLIFNFRISFSLSRVPFNRLRFDEIGHDLFTDSDSLSYASLSRSSSLIQFESLERQLQNETTVSQHPLSGSSPSLYTCESSTPGAYNGAGGGVGESTVRGKGPIGPNGATAELLSATVRCHSGRCSADRLRPSSGGRGGASAARNKNSIESLSEDSGYCDHQLGGGISMNNYGLRARSKSLTMLTGSAENITFVCGNGAGVGMFPSALLPVAMTQQQQQQHEQQQPLSLDCITMEVRHVASSALYQENRLSTVCDVDEEEEAEEYDDEQEEDEEEDSKCDDGCSVDAVDCIAVPSPVTIDRQQHQLWTNINNGTKIEHGSDSCKQRADESRQQSVLEVASRTVTSMASSSSRSEIKNSTARLRPVLSLSAPDLLVGAAERQRRQRRQPADDRTSASAAAAAAGTSVGLYDPISFTVSSVPECLNLYGGLSTNRSRLGSFDNGDGYGYGACVDSIASKNFNLYDLQQPRSADRKCAKTVTFQTASPSRPKQNIRASYANLTALNYSDEEEEANSPLYGGHRGHEYYLSRNTFRTSSGTRLGGASRTASHQIVPRTTTLPTMDRHRPLSGKMSEAVVVEEDLADEEERSIFPVDRDEQSVFHSLLEEMSAHFDRNLSIINDQAEAYEPIAAFLHEQRTAAVPCAAGRLQPSTNCGGKTPPQAPPRRTQIKTNPHVPQSQAVSPSVPVRVSVTSGGASGGGADGSGPRRRTFDQDPTNLVTCYAASLERCTFDPTESSTSSLIAASPSSSDLHTNRGGTVALPRYVPVPVKREFVASTPNLHYYHGAVPDGQAQEDREDTRPDHHNSLRNVSTSRSTASILATASSSRCGLSKGVSFCPIVSEIIWKSTGSSDLDEPEDNGSVISNQDFEIDIDEEDFEADDLDHANYRLESNGQGNGGVPEHTKSDGQLYPSVPLQSKIRSEGELYAMIREEDGGVQHPMMTLIVNDRPETVRVGGGSVGGVNGAGQVTPGDLSYSGGDLSSAGQSNRIRMLSASVGAGEINGGAAVMEEERRNHGGGRTNGAMASRSLIASEMRLVNNSENPTLMKSGSAATMPNPYSSTTTTTTTNNNSSLIKNFKNGKAEKKGKTFLSRISSGFRFSFRNKSKKGSTVSGGGGTLKESASFAGMPTSAVTNNNNHINAKHTGGHQRGASSTSANCGADFIYIPLKDPQQSVHRADEPPTYLQRQAASVAGVTVDDSFTGAEDEPDDCEIAVTRPGGPYRSDSSTALNAGDGGGTVELRGRPASNHVLSSKPPLPKQPPRVVGVCAKRSSTSPASQKHAHAQRASSTPPRDADDGRQDTELDSTAAYQRRSPQYGTANGSYGSYHGGPDTLSVEGYDEDDECYYGAGGDGRLLLQRRGSTMGSEQKIGLIETNLDTHETIISGKTRSLMELGGGYRGYHPHHHHLLQQHNQQQPAASASHHHHQLQVHDPAQRQQSAGAAANGEHRHHRQSGGGDGPGRPHKSMEFLLDKENQRNVLVSLCLKRFLCFFVSTRLDQSC